MIGAVAAILIATLVPGAAVAVPVEAPAAPAAAQTAVAPQVPATHDAAHAAGRAAENTTARGDVNGDRITDVVTLGPIPPGSDDHTCTVKVAYGKADGTFGAPVESRYTSPLGAAPYCPDMLVVADLGGDGKPEIVTTGFQWYDATKAFLVLRRVNGQIKPVATYPGVSFPSTLRKVDFTGDGRDDFWVSTDQEQTLRSFTNTADGKIVPGAINLCSRKPIPQVAFADFDGDGGQDLLVSRQCGFGYTTAELDFGNGGKPAVTFARDDSGAGSYEVFPTFHNWDGFPDVGVITTLGSSTTVQYFLNDGTGAFTPEA